MWCILLVAALFPAGQDRSESTVIAGAVVAPAQQTVSQPLQVILLPSRYLDLWNSEVQKRLDQYWQQYLPALRDKKELFTEFLRQAHFDATVYVLTRMRLDPNSRVSDYQRETGADGTFEFRNVPFGEYKVLAIGRVGNREVLWHEVIDVRTSIPQFLELKTHVP